MLERFYQRTVDHKTPLEYIRGDEYSRALDLGCGDGRISSQLSEIAENVVGVEVNRDRLLEFQANGIPENQQIAQADGTQLPFPDDYFDLVMSYTVYEHIPEKDIQSYLSELHRVLEPGGTAYIVNDAFFYRVLRQLRLVYPERGPDPTHINMVTPNTMASEIEAAGFKIKILRYSPFHHFLSKEPAFLSLFATKGYVVAIAD